MYCSNCGTFIEDGRSFCSNCGEKISGVVVSGHSNSNEGNGLFECCNELNKIIQPLQRVEELYKKTEMYRKAANNVGKDETLVANIASGALGLLGGAIFALFVPGIIAFILIFVIFAFFRHMFEKGIKTKKSEKQKQYEMKIHEFQESAQSDYDIVYPILSRYIPSDYWYSDAIISFTTYFRNGRADNLKEAINLYEEELSRLRMENMQAAILRENQKQTTFSALTAINTALTAYNTAGLKNLL